MALKIGRQAKRLSCVVGRNPMSLVFVIARSMNE